jgi:hypothetical protein
MRLSLKLIAIVVVTLACQLVIEGGGGPVDRACFMIRAYCDHLAGVPANDPALMEAAKRLAERSWEREQLLMQSTCNASTGPERNAAGTIDR